MSVFSSGDTPPGVDRWQPMIVGALAFTAFAGLLVHAFLYLPFLSDDALISLRYAQRLLDGDGLTWTAGPRVEGYSNLLWILLVAAAGAVKLDLIFAARVLGVVCHGIVIAALASGCRDTDGRLIGLAAGLMTLVMAGPIAIWTIGGLEQPLLAALLAWVVVLSPKLLGETDPPRRRITNVSLVLGLMCLTRPDGPLFIAAVAVALIIGRGLNRGAIVIGARVASVPAAVVLSQLVFRLAYYHAWLPNPALVKLAPSVARIGDGASYVWQGLRSLAPVSGLWPLLMIVLFLNRSSRPAAIIQTVFSLLWLGYVAVIGGDIFPGHRHMVPIVVIMTITVTQAIAVLWREWPSHLVRIAIAALLVVVFSTYIVRQFEDRENLRAAEEGWEWDGKVVGLVLQRAFGDTEPLFAVTAAGCLPYWSRLPSIDMLGLNDHHIPRHPPEGFGHGPLAHELGDGGYVLDRRPDLVSFCGPWGSMRACYPSGRQMQADPRFLRTFTSILVRGTEPHEFTAILWINRESAKIGIHRGADTVTIPGYLLDADPRTIAHPDADGRLVVTVTSERPAGIVLPMPLGDWHAEVDTDNPGNVSVDLQDAGNGLTEIQVTATAPAEIRRLRLVNGLSTR